MARPARATTPAAKLLTKAVGAMSSLVLVVGLEPPSVSSSSLVVVDVDVDGPTVVVTTVVLLLYSAYQQRSIGSHLI